jgi:hypothetical protein
VHARTLSLGPKFPQSLHHRGLAAALPTLTNNNLGSTENKDKNFQGFTAAKQKYMYHKQKLLVTSFKTSIESAYYGSKSVYNLYR